MRNISHCEAREDWTLDLVFEDGQRRIFDVKPLLDCEAFSELKDLGLFLAIQNRGYFVEWPNGADLSADTLCLEGRAA
jgi:hypothetical protein